MGLYRAYLSSDVLRGFDTYKYSSLDTSPLSNYIMHPFWNQVVKICPMWIAPNLLTFVGFMCCVAHNMLTAIYDYNFTANDLSVPESAPIPNSIWLLVSFLLFLSHTLDGIDGKQARRTKSSTPLGELFDHGCDAWSTVFIAATFYSTFGRHGDGFSVTVFRMYAILWSVFFSFQVSHWEKYNTGIMYLPWSYDIAMVGGYTLYFFTAILGYETWKVKLPGDYSAGPVLETTLYIFTYCLATPVAIKNIITSYQDGTGKMRPFWEAIRPMVSFAAAMTLCFTWVLCSPSEILERDVRMFFLMSGTVYANMSCRLIVSQMSGTRCELLNLLILSLCVAVCASLGLNLSAAAELSVLYGLTALVLLAHTHYVVCVVIQMCEHLKIDCFKIQPVKKQD